MRPVRELLRLAQRLHAVFESRHRVSSRDRQIDWQRLEMRMDDVRRRRHLAELSQSHGWHLAAQKQRQLLLAVLRSLNEAVSHVREKWLERPPEVPRLHDLFAELQHLEIEFGEIDLGGKTHFLAVTTEPITLERVELGPFRIELYWDRLSTTCGAQCFDIVAFEPNPAGNDRTICHPHVKNQSLCAGEAMIPIQKALEQGRLVDAFCLIRSVLKTYNGASAYVALDDWTGVSCASCGYTPDADDVHSCECCEQDICADCTSSCGHCDRTFCTSCQTRCDVCDRACCNRCLRTSECSETRCCAKCLRACPTCGSKVASNELADETKQCPSCAEESTEDVNVPQKKETLSEPTL